MKPLKDMFEKRFSIYVANEFERTTGFLGLMRVLHMYSDFFEYTVPEQKAAIKNWVKTGEVYIDANIYAKFK